jgi:hypothetical protein
MRIYFQHPPTGEFPCLGLNFYEVEKRADLYIVWSFRTQDGYEDVNDWLPFRGPLYMAHLHSPNGFLDIPCFNLEGKTFDEVLVTIEELLQKHPNSEEGAFGIWSRGFYQILPDCFDIDLGIVWHPDPNAFERCQAQADLESRTWKGRELDGDLRWRAVYKIRTMLESIFKAHPGLKHAR